MILSWFDNLFTKAANHSELLVGRFSWRLHEWIWHIIVHLHEYMWLVSRLFGWKPVPNKLFMSSLGIHAKALPPSPLFFAFSGKVSNQAKELVKGVRTLKDGTVLRIDSLIWHNDRLTGESATDRLLFHALDWVRVLSDAYLLTRHTDFLLQAKLITARWISECSFSERSALIWDDHITALRACILCRLWEICRRTEPVDTIFMRHLLSTIVRHAEKLNNESLYRHEHNHGVTQAYALMVIGFMFPLLPAAKKWTKAGCLRLESQMAENVLILTDSVDV
jgi:hypothetical protein